MYKSTEGTYHRRSTVRISRYETRKQSVDDWWPETELVHTLAIVHTVQ